MDVYRFMSKARAEKFLAGEVGIGRLRFYRLMELAYGDRYIGDRREGEQETTGSFVPGDDAANKLILERISQHVRVKAKTFVFENNTFIRHVDGFALSCSAGDLESLSQRVHEGALGPNLPDACIRITHAEEFAKVLWEEGTLASGAKVREQFEPPQCGLVTYDLAPADLRQGPIQEADPFRKDSFYAPQSEWRLFLKANEGTRLPFDFDRIVLTCAPEVLEPFLQKVDAGLPAAPSQESRHTRDWVRALIDIYACWSQLLGALALLTRILEPGSDGQEANLGPWKHFMNQRMCVNAWEQEEFDRRYRLDLTKAYFELRKTGVTDERMEEGILGSSQIGILMIELKLLLRRLGHLPTPWPKT